MTDHTTNSARSAAPDPQTRQPILASFYRDGHNTCEIGRSLGLHEAVVAEVLHQDRESRAKAAQPVGGQG